MRKEYDFARAKRNPYAKPLKQSVTMRLGKATVDYFKAPRRGTGCSISDADQLTAADEATIGALVKQAVS